MEGSPPPTALEATQVKEAELRERLLQVLPTLHHPTFTVIQSQFSSRLKRGLLDRTLRHMTQHGELERVRTSGPKGDVTQYRLTPIGLTERARILLAQRSATTRSS